jgi:hypothetical protein
MAKYIQDLSQFLQSFGVAALTLLFLPVLIAALARNVVLALTASLLSFTSLMLFIAPASATSGLAIASGVGSFLVALESVIARGRMMAFDKQLQRFPVMLNRLSLPGLTRQSILFARRWMRGSSPRTTVESSGSIRAESAVADLTSRVNQLENAEQRRLALEVKRRGQNRRK